MAIYSLHHTAIGKSTQARPHTTAAHVRYIARPQAMRHFEAARCPSRPSAAMRYFRAQEDLDRVNGRVSDKLMLALPRELNPKQRVELVRGFAEDATKGRAPWLAAFHDKGKDANNPHCHLVIRDRDPDTGMRVIGTSEKGSTERFRQMWERHANLALKKAGHTQRIDRRSLRAQGVDRPATIHEGPRAREMDFRGAAPTSRRREARNAPGARSGKRDINYPDIDRGRSRPQYNRMLRAKDTEADCWDAIDRDQQQREFDALGFGRAPAARSVKGIGWSPIEAKPGKQTIPTSGHQRPVAVPASLPRGDTRFVSRPASFVPTANDVAFGQRNNEGPEVIAKYGRPMPGHRVPKLDEVKRKPTRAASGDSTQDRAQANHKESMRPSSQTARGGAMPEEDDRLKKRHLDAFERIKFDADQSRGRFDDLMKRSFLDPQAAERRMDEYRAKHGNEALYDKLNHEELGSPYGRSVKFGRRPGSLASSDYLKPGSQDLRTDSHNARRQLPEATRKMIDDRDKMRGAEKTLGRARGEQPPVARPAAKEFPSVDERQANQHRGLEQPGQPPAATKKSARVPDASRMSPQQQQLRHYPRMLEQPSAKPMVPTMPVEAPKAAPPMSKPPMSAAPSPDAKGVLTPSRAKKKGVGMEM